MRAVSPFWRRPLAIRVAGYCTQIWLFSAAAWLLPRAE